MSSLAEVASTGSIIKPEREIRRRRRPALSCIECRRRKIRCDRTEPCKNCIAIKVQCVYKTYANDRVVRQQHPYDRSSILTESLANRSVAPLQLAQGVSPDRPTAEHVSYIPGAQLGLSTPAVTPHGVLDTPRSERKSPSNNGDAPNLDLRHQLQRAQRVENGSVSSPLQGLDETGWQILKRQAGVKEKEVVLNKVRIPKWSEWMGIAPEVL